VTAAFTAAESCPPAAEAEGSLRQLEDEWAAAFVRHDPKPLARILADEWVMSRADAALRDKATYMARVANDPDRHTSIVRDDERIRVYGCSAVYTYRPTRTTEGQAFTFRTTDVFVHLDGRWQMVARHISEVPAP
jgi:hypothetical protein